MILSTTMRKLQEADKPVIRVTIPSFCVNGKWIPGLTDYFATRTGALACVGSWRMSGVPKAVVDEVPARSLDLHSMTPVIGEPRLAVAPRLH